MMRQRLAKRIKSVMILGCVLLFLTGCGARGPENKIVQKAIAFEFQQTQEALSQQLHTAVPKFKIKHVVVDEKEALRLGGLAAYHLQGQYDAEVKFPGRRYTQTDYPFDLYLQQLPESDLWRLAIPLSGDDEDATEQQWKTYALYEEVAEVETSEPVKPNKDEKKAEKKAMKQTAQTGAVSAKASE